ncbi:carbohydrate ABC transporter permease [Cohnella nanjingensis]|uniref:Carbohydrate ABC transporter permease n=1 Tax=Cohnella nanjingensis TaxID=1387779 RepID=A0A7X0VFB0_9BACL|nr:carbohydrate ABC transporter permease [Cohnella nanjingensis]MBB6671636.1 carbohydrate ABC transporter permease [Cohnella nanjingensis]
MRLSPSERVFQTVIYVLLALLSFVTLYPFWNSLVISFNLGSDTSLGGVTFWPRSFTLQNYEVVLRDGRIAQAFLVSVARTAAGTALSIMATAIFSYGMSKAELIGRKYYMIFCIVTLYFSGGLIPYFLLIHDLGMMNTFWVLIVPGMISIWNMIIFRTFFKEMPAGLEESARIDGCGYFSTFVRIVLPLSGPVIASLSLFVAVNLWNDWFSATLFINNPKLVPIQSLLQEIMNANTVTEQLRSQGGSNFLDKIFQARTVTTKSLTMATMMVATIPIIAVYPFVQRHFVKGVLVGSLKG